MLHQVELLKDESDGRTPKSRASGVVKLAHVLSAHANRSRRREIEEAEQAQHGGLPRARGPDDRQEFARMYPEAHLV